MLPSNNLLEDTYNRIRSYIHYTPVLFSSTINRIAGCNVYFKCENFQKMGAFKMRGAINAILQLSDEEREKGVVTHSSGNFAQAVALAAGMEGIKSYIVMPVNASEFKKTAVIGYGGKLIECEPGIQAREERANEIVNETGAVLLHSSNQLNVITGQGTACMELLEEIKDLSRIIVPVGGGGLLAGTALAAYYNNRNIEVIGAEPFGADDAYHSLKTGIIQPSVNPVTIADGLKTNLGDVNFPIIKQLVKEIIRVEEDEIVSSMRLIWERMKIIAEPSSAVALAALLRNTRKFNNMNTGIILSGGNVDLNHLPF